MKTATNSPVVSKTLSRTVIEETPANAFRFLQGASKSEILRQLRPAGYTSADHEEGWKLFLLVTKFASQPEPESPENKAASAVSLIQNWVGQGFQRVHALWDRKYPEVSAFVFTDIDSSDNGAVYDLATFLDRCKDLQSGAARKATRKNDHAALEALAQRGIGEDVLKNLTSLLEVAQVQPVVGPVEVKDNGRTAAITELYLWLRDWRETARAVIKNRTQLISLGIGKRHSRKTSVTPSPSPVTITPVAPSAPPAPAPLQLVAGSPNKVA